MKKVSYFDPFTYNETILDIDDALYNLTEGINNHLIKTFEAQHVTSSIVGPDGTAFVIGVRNGENKYKIEISIFKPEY